MFERTTNTISKPPFIVDPNMIVRDTGRQIDWDALDDRYDHGAAMVVLTEEVAVDETDVTVQALTKPLRVGEILDFGDVGTVRAVLRVAAAAAVGAVSITVDPADVIIPTASVAYYGGAAGATGGGRFIPAGTVMDLQADGTIVPSAMALGGITAFCLLATNADEESRTDAASGYGIIKSGAIYENMLPEADGATPSVIASAWKTELLARGGFWMFEQYEDDTA